MCSTHVRACVSGVRAREYALMRVCACVCVRAMRARGSVSVCVRACVHARLPSVVVPDARSRGHALRRTRCNAQVLVNTLIKSVPALLDVLLVLFFLVLVFSICGLQLWQGARRARRAFAGKWLDPVLQACSTSVATHSTTAPWCLPSSLPVPSLAPTRTRSCSPALTCATALCTALRRAAAPGRAIARRVLHDLAGLQLR